MRGARLGTALQDPRDFGRVGRRRRALLVDPFPERRLSVNWRASVRRRRVKDVGAEAARRERRDAAGRVVEHVSWDDTGALLTTSPRVLPRIRLSYDDLLKFGWCHRIEHLWTWSNVCLSPTPWTPPETSRWLSHKSYQLMQQISGKEIIDQLQKMLQAQDRSAPVLWGTPQIYADIQRRNEYLERQLGPLMASKDMNFPLPHLASLGLFHIPKRAAGT